MGRITSSLLWQAEAQQHKACTCARQSTPTAGMWCCPGARDVGQPPLTSKQAEVIGGPHRDGLVAECCLAGPHLQSHGLPEAHSSGAARMMTQQACAEQQAAPQSHHNSYSAHPAPVHPSPGQHASGYPPCASGLEWAPAPPSPRPSAPSRPGGRTCGPCATVSE